jgi:hypothetical protein
MAICSNYINSLFLFSVTTLTPQALTTSAPAAPGSTNSVSPANYTGRMAANVSAVTTILDGPTVNTTTLMGSTVSAGGSINCAPTENAFAIMASKHMISLCLIAAFVSLLPFYSSF